MSRPWEEKILRKRDECQLITREELLKLFSIDSSKTTVDSVLNSLIQKNYIHTINPVGSKCFVITRNGIQALEGRE